MLKHTMGMSQNTLVTANVTRDAFVRRLHVIVGNVQVQELGSVSRFTIATAPLNNVTTEYVVGEWDCVFNTGTVCLENQAKFV